MATVDLAAFDAALREIYSVDDVKVYQHHPDCLTQRHRGVYKHPDCTCPDWHRAAQALGGMGE